MTAGGTAGTSGTGQSRAMSLVEAVASAAVGYPVSGGDALAISRAFTVVSLVRSVALRRLFEAVRVQSDY